MSVPTLNIRERLHRQIEATCAAVRSHAGELTADAIAVEVQSDADELAIASFQAGLCAALGSDLGPVVFADLTNHLGESDADLAKRFGLERSTVSKILIRVRKNLGLPVRQPSKSRPNRKTRTPQASK